MQKELKLEVGSKKWSIQLGDCVIEIIDYNLSFPIICRNREGKSCTFTSKGHVSYYDYSPSLFESNPFDHVTPNDVSERSVDTNETIEPKLVRQQNNGWVDSKAEMINALMRVFECQFLEEETRIIAESKLQKLLESL